MTTDGMEGLTGGEVVALLGLKELPVGRGDVAGDLAG